MIVRFFPDASCAKKTRLAPVFGTCEAGGPEWHLGSDTVLLLEMLIQIGYLNFKQLSSISILYHIVIMDYTILYYILLYSTILYYSIRIYYIIPYYTTLLDYILLYYGNITKASRRPGVSIGTKRS